MPFRLKKEPDMVSVTPVENVFLREYMPIAPEGNVKVYLFGLMLCTDPDFARYDMPGALGMSDEEILSAYQYWQSLGLVRILSGDPIVVEYRTLASIARSAASPTRRYASLTGSLQQILGTRVLSGTELAKVYDWAEVFGFEESAILMLVRWCVSAKGPRISINYMDSVAKGWADAAILTAEAAEAHIAGLEEMLGGAQSILKRFRISRRPTEDELNLYRIWTEEWGFDEQAVLSACAETTSAIKPSFKYLNAILETCRARGATSITAIEAYLRGRDALYELARLIFQRAGLKRGATAREVEQIEVWRDTWHMSPELLLLASEFAFGGSSPFTAIRQTLERWHKLALTTVDAAREDYAKAGAAPQKKKSGATAYPQRNYTQSEYDSLLTKLLDDEEDV